VIDIDESNWIVYCSVMEKGGDVLGGHGRMVLNWIWNALVLSQHRKKRS